MINIISIETRITKKPLRTEGRFVEITHIRLLLNGVTLYETNSDIYVVSAQELIEIMLEKASNLIQALEKQNNAPTSIRHGVY